LTTDEPALPEAQDEPREEEQRPLTEEELLGADQEVLLGDDEQSELANKALRALARASRSYLIYDPRNEAIRAFLEEVKRSFELYSQKYGDLDLHIRPFELMLGRRAVYLERDRERSLAFKLFRDGVRRMTIQAGVDWHELTQLLGVLSVRYVGIRQNPAEDDIVTLLWKAGFSHINIEAVEGFVPEDDDDPGGGLPAIGADGMLGGAPVGGSVGSPIGPPGGPSTSASILGGEPGQGDATAAHAAHAGADAAFQRAAYKVPAGFDLPPPDLYDEKPVHYRSLREVEKEALLEEDASTYLPDLVLQLIQELLQIARDPTDPLAFDNVVHMIRDARDFLLTENQLDTLLALFAELNDFHANCPADDLDELDRLLATMASTGALRRVLKTIPREAISPPKEFYELLEVMPGDPLPALVELLGDERDQSTRRHLRITLESYLPARAALVVEAFQAASGGVAADLIRVLANAAPEAAQQAVADIASSSDTTVQLEFLKLAEHLPVSTTTRTMLVQLLRSTDEEVRIRTLEVVVGMGERGAFTAVQRFAEQRAKKGANTAELEACGRAMARLHPARAFDMFREWASYGGLLARLAQRGQPLRRVAIAGMELVDHSEVEGLLRTVAAKGDEDERQAALATLMRRQRTLAGEDA